MNLEIKSIIRSGYLIISILNINWKLEKILSDKLLQNVFPALRLTENQNYFLEKVFVLCNTLAK